MAQKKDKSMANRVEQQLQKPRAGKVAGLAPYLTAGDGGLERTLALLHVLENAGASCCELGVPFSDPIADGPTLQAAATRALRAGTTLPGIFDCVHKFRDQGGQLPIALMSYCNPLMQLGWAGCCKRAAQVGIDALIVPDLPPEEADQLYEAAGAQGLGTVFFASPTSSDERIARAAEISTAFLYVVGRVGTTGSNTTFDEPLRDYLRRVQGLALDCPLALGFGISTADSVKEAGEYVDLVIVGSALVKRIHDAGPQDSSAVQAAKSYLKELRVTS